MGFEVLVAAHRAQIPVAAPVHDRRFVTPGKEVAAEFVADVQSLRI